MFLFIMENIMVIKLDSKVLPYDPWNDEQHGLEQNNQVNPLIVLEHVILPHVHVVRYIGMVLHVVRILQPAQTIRVGLEGACELRWNPAVDWFTRILIRGEHGAEEHERRHCVAVVQPVDEEIVVAL
jgi:hypothetical protein